MTTVFEFYISSKLHFNVLLNCKKEKAMNKGIRKSFSKIPINRREILRGKFLTLQHHGSSTHGAEKEDTSAQTKF